MPDALHDAVTSLLASVDRVVTKVDALLPAMNRLSTSSEQLAKKNVRWKALVVSIAVLFLGVVGLVWQVHRQSSCITSWANASTSRAGTLTKLSLDRSKKLRQAVDAEHDVSHYALAHPNGTAAQAKHEIALIAVWDQATTAYQTADDIYNKASADNPVPASPKYSCSMLTL